MARICLLYTTKRRPCPHFLGYIVITRTWWRHQMETFSALLIPLWEESTCQRWIPLTKSSDSELWCFLWSVPEQRVVQTIETPVILDAIALIMTSLNVCNGLQIDSMGRLISVDVLPLLHLKCGCCLIQVRKVSTAPIRFLGSSLSSFLAFFRLASVRVQTYPSEESIVSGATRTFRRQLDVKLLSSAGKT